MECVTCGDKTAKAGKDRNGLQRFKCATCAKTFTEPHAMAGKHTSMADTVKVLAMLLEGMSIRSCERLTGIHRDTILGLMVEAGESCRRFMETNISKVPAQYIECDEQWAFIFCKRRTAEAKGFSTEECGDRYVFTAIDETASCCSAGMLANVTRTTLGRSLTSCSSVSAVDQSSIRTASPVTRQPSPPRSTATVITLR